MARIDSRLDYAPAVVTVQDVYLYSDVGLEDRLRLVPTNQKEETMNYTKNDVDHVLGMLSREIIAQRELFDAGDHDYDAGILFGLESALELVQTGFRLRAKYRANSPE